MRDERLKPVAFCGENPVMELVNPATKEVSVAASYWRCTYSAHGAGNVLLVYVDAANAAALGQPSVAIYSDNVPLARYVTDTFNQHFDGWKTHRFASAEVQPARFYKEADTRQFYRLACHTHNAVIDLLWSDIKDCDFRMMADLNGGGFGVASDEHYHVSNVIFLCAQGSLRVNQKQAFGDAQTRTSDTGKFSSSVFVALSETWVRTEAVNKE